MRHARPGMREYEIEAELLHEFRRHGAQSVAYNTIVATGPNARVLHYPAGDAVLEDGHLLLVDGGCEVDGYASGHHAAAFPVNGRYSGPQRLLYDLTVAAQDAASAATRPGLSWNDGHDAALRVLAQGMIDAGLLQGSLDGVLESKAYNRFYMHRTGHWLGLDVHDVGDYRVLDAPAGRAPLRVLERGMLLTIGAGHLRAAWRMTRPRFSGISASVPRTMPWSPTKAAELITRGVPVDAREIEGLDAEQRRRVVEST